MRHRRPNDRYYPDPPADPAYCPKAAAAAWREYEARGGTVERLEPEAAGQGGRYAFNNRSRNP